MEELGRAYGVSVFAILRRLISAETVLEVSRHIVSPAGRVVLEYSIDVGVPGAGDLTKTPLVPVTMTDVTVQQPVDIGSSGTISGLTVTASQ